MGVDDDGKIQYLIANIIEDNGCNNNEGILEFTFGSFPNCYKKETWSVKTGTVNTDTASNSYMRAPGKKCRYINKLEKVHDKCLRGFVITF